ncbi:MAG: pyridoxamine 5'-phosphate oxidase family protein [Nitriliruptorales bacterium]|nr:pyridoxamine 5'-phosphate oxidase family protein [Nitriliruptorales bacterium]
MTDRPLDKGQLEVLSSDECWELLAAEPVGRIAFVEAGEPTILPVNYFLDGRSIVFRTTHGAKLSDAALSRPVAFEVDAYDEDERTGWSVLVRGTADDLNAADAAALLDEAGFEPSAEEAGWEQWVRVRPDEISGRRIPDRD